MAFPRLSDDGTSVEIDLHGATIAEAEQILDRLFPLAASRGRNSVRVIHGSSTYESGRGSIKEMLYAGLDDRRWPAVQSAVRFEDFAIVSLTTAGRAGDPAPITMLELTR